MAEENQVGIHVNPVNGEATNTPNGGVAGNQLFRRRYHRRNVVTSELFEKFKSDGIIVDCKFGAKTCFSTNRLDYKQIDTLKAALRDKDDPNKGWDRLNESQNGWIAAVTLNENGERPAENIREALDVFKEYAKNDKDVFLTTYGEVHLTVNFEKLNMLQFENGNIVYPYGIFFFSDTKTPSNAFNATVACLPDRYSRLRDKYHLHPITSDNWTNAEIHGNFNRNGHFVIFYVDEEVEKSAGLYSPVVRTIDIEVFTNRNVYGNYVTQCAIGRVEENSKCYEDVIPYLIDNVYGRYASPSDKVERFMRDYVFVTGYNPKNYKFDLKRKEGTNAIQKAEQDDEVTETQFESNFGGKNDGTLAKVGGRKNIQNVEVEEEVPVEENASSEETSDNQEENPSEASNEQQSNGDQQ